MSRVSRAESTESNFHHDFSGAERNQQVWLSALGTDFTRMVFTAHEVQVHAELSNLLPTPLYNCHKRC
eukprot:6967556-Prymnesium_polylepis.1